MKIAVNNALIERENIVHALEAAWYAMEKYAPELCGREIKIARAILENYGRLPKSSDVPNAQSERDDPRT